MSPTTACPRCQTPPEEGARFCQVCGMSLSGELTVQLPTLTEVLRQATAGEYEILAEIGQGGMATVYLAQELALDRRVAIKVMLPGAVQNRETIERFKREARTAAGLNHPHIVPIYAVREAEHLLFMVMKFVNGRSLDSILRDTGALSFGMVRTLLHDIASALDYAHRQGVVHRDVKPGNILVDDEGFAFITDFGIAKAHQGENLTRTGTTVGTPSYLSPEACSGEAVGPPADQYSLGIVGYEMVTGQLPFIAESSLGMMYAQVHTAPRPSEQLRPDLPPDLRDAIMQMLEKDPEDRFPSLKEAVLAIGDAVEDANTRDGIRTHIGLLALPTGESGPGGTPRTPLSPSPLSTSPSSRRRSLRKRRTRRLQIAAGALGTALFATAAYFALRTDRPAVPTADSTAALAQAQVAQHNDSLFMSARGAADYARSRAVAAGASAKALASGDSLQQHAESLAAAGQKTEAALLLSQAAGLWSAAERPAPANAPSTSASTRAPRPAPAQQSAAAPVAQAPAEQAAAKPPSDSAQVVEFFSRLEHAIESRQLGEIRNLLPNLTEKEAKNWLNLFNDEKVQSVGAAYDVRSVTPSEPGMFVATVFEEVNAVRTNGKVDTKRSGMQEMTLTFGPSGWRLIRSRKAPQ